MTHTHYQCSLCNQSVYIRRSTHQDASLVPFGWRRPWLLRSFLLWMNNFVPMLKTLLQLYLLTSELFLATLNIDHSEYNFCYHLSCFRCLRTDFSGRLRKHFWSFLKTIWALPWNFLSRTLTLSFMSISQYNSSVIFQLTCRASSSKLETSNFPPLVSIPLISPSVAARVYLLPSQVKTLPPCVTRALTWACLSYCRTPQERLASAATWAFMFQQIRLSICFTNISYAPNWFPLDFDNTLLPPPCYW